MSHLSFHSTNVHCWSTAIDVTDQIYDVLIQRLSPDERTRADQFVFSPDRRNFIVARGILRDILSRYLHCQAAEIRFCTELNGKPGLDCANTSIRLDFNLSHSSGYLVVAVTQGKKVGVDIEMVRPVPDIDLITSQSFSEYERNMLALLTGEEKLLGFYRCWTRKEAYLKAVGSGLSIPLDSFDVSLAEDNPIEMVSNRLDPNQISRWSFYSFTPAHGFIGALVIEGQVVTPYFKQWNSDDG
jgi:4'-phosphopantetheinyl transferase